MIATSKIEIDILSPGILPRVSVSQGDYYSRKVEFTLLAGGEPWTLPENAIVGLRYSKPDSTTGSYDTLPDGEQAWAYTGNVLTLTLAPQMLTTPGCVSAQAEIVAEGSILATFLFQILVVQDPSRPILQSKDYFNWQQWTAAQLDERLRQAQADGFFIPTFTIGTVTTLAQGASATAEIRGTAQNPILDLGIPVGSDILIDSTLTLADHAADAKAAGDAIRQLSTEKADMSVFLDHIVAEGTSGAWYYRKWESGRAELWGQWTVAEAVTSSGTDGQKWAVLTSGVSYPFTFVSTPLLVSGIVNQGSESLVALRTNSVGVSSAHTGPWYVITAAQQTITNLTWGLYVTGRWQ